MGLLSSILGLVKKREAEPFGRVEITDVQVVYHGPKKEERIAWSELIEIGIVTTDEGPFQEDVYFLLLGPDREHGCAIPQGATGTQKLVERLQALPGFENDALIRAMGCTDNNRFLCWQKKAPNHSTEPLSPSLGGSS